MRSLLWELYELNFCHKLYALDRALVLHLWASDQLLPHLPGTPFRYFPWQLMVRTRYSAGMKPNGHVHFRHGDHVSVRQPIPRYIVCVARSA